MDKYLAFTLKENMVVDRLETPVLLDSRIRDCSIAVDPNKKWRGVWDTGAKTSSVHKRIVNELGLYAVNDWTMQTANGIAIVTTYFVDITLPNNVMVSNILVSASDLGDETDVLIGMDIISQGDFSISNVNGSTTFSFRIPSVKEIDYVKEANDTNRCLPSEDK